MEEIAKYVEKFMAATDEEKMASLKNLLMQNKQLAAKIQQLQEVVTFKQLDYLIKIVDTGLFSDAFTDKCKHEIERIMFGEPEKD